MDSPDFPFDWETHRAFAESAYRNDTRLHKLLPRLVPKHVTEEVFWRNYFSHVFAIKCRFAGKQVAPPAAPAEPTAPDGGEEEPQLDDASTRLARAASLTSQLAYPERFELALKYVREGPSLPHDAAPGDRILMDVLSQQATIGQCNTPRPGMWDSAEAKARHEAWVKLGSMSKHEAMHLYVQALEIFRKDWVLWEGLQITADMIKRADAVSTPKREPSGNGGGGSVSASGRAAAAASPQLSPPPAVTVPNGSASPAAPNGSVPPSAAPGEGETLFLLDISPSSRALSMLLELLPATRHIAVVSVARIADLPEPVQKGCAKLPLLVNPSTGFELWDAHAIMGYLAQKYAPQLPNGMAGADFAFPTDPEGSAMVSALRCVSGRDAALVAVGAFPARSAHAFPPAPHASRDRRAISDPAIPRIQAGDALARCARPRLRPALPGLARLPRDARPRAARVRRERRAPAADGAEPSQHRLPRADALPRRGQAVRRGRLVRLRRLAARLGQQVRAAARTAQRCCGLCASTSR